ncbi:hypothetical protein DPMN_052258, partial [Dreissena polymorpha]
SKDQGELFDFMFESLKTEPDKSEGVGRLMFEMMKGVKGQFHSCAQKVFPMLLKRLGPVGKQKGSWLPWQHVEDSMATTVLSMAFHADLIHLKDVWHMILDSIVAVQNRCQDSKKTSAVVKETVGRLLRLLDILLTFKGGKVICEPNQIAKVILSLLQSGCFPSEVGQDIVKVTSSLILNANTNLDVSVTTKIIQTVFMTSYPAKLVYTFTKSLYDLALFEKDVLPPFLKYCQKLVAENKPELDEETLGIITDLVVCKCPLLSNGDHLESMDTYILDFGESSVGRSVPDLVTGILNHSSLDKENLPRLWAALVCLPHIRPLQKRQALIGDLSELTKQLIGQMSHDQSAANETLYLIGCQALVTMVMLLDNQEVFQHVPVNVITECLCAHSTDVHTLRLADVYFSHAKNQSKDDVLNSDTLMAIFSALQINLSSPHADIRHLTLRILAGFDLPLPPSEGEATSVFEICLSAETTEASLHQYRERQRHLQKLDFCNVQNCLPAGPFNEVPLRYLLGSLFVNMKLLWEPIRTLIAGHAQQMDRTAFWDIFGSHLEQAAEQSEKHLHQTDTSLTRGSANDDEDDDTKTESPTASRLLMEATKSLQGVDSTPPDFVNFRHQLWQTMQLFSDRSSGKSRLLVPLLFRFLENEYYLSDMSIAPTQNIMRKLIENLQEETMDCTESTDNIVAEPKESENKVANKQGKRLTGQDLKEDSVKEAVASNVKRPNTSSSVHNIEEVVEISKDENIDDNDDGDTALSSGIKTRSQRAAKAVVGNSVEVRSLRTRTGNQRRAENELDLVSPISASNSESKKKEGHVKEDFKQNVSRRIKTRSIAKIDGTYLDMDVDEEVIDLTEDDPEDVEKSNSEDNDDTKQENSVTEVVTEAEKYDKLSAIEENEKEIAVELGDTETSGKKKAKDKSNKTDAAEKRKRKAAASSLVVHLALFAKFTEPLSMYREPELRKLYYELLIHKNSEVQKTAFRCLMTYKFKYLVPYKENFERLLEDKSFKNEIVLFSIDNETSVVSPEHRQDALTVLMRILYGKMHVKTGKNTSGKQHSSARQSIVLGFLNGCSHQELALFIELVFAPFQGLVSENPLKMVKHIKDETDLTCVLPVNRMQGALNSIDMLFKKLGHLLDTFLPTVIQIIVGMATLCGVLLSNRDRVVLHALNPLKNIRQNAVYRITQLFNEYDKYPWRPVELDALFEGAVWPQLDRLSYEGIYHPTPLLKLLHCWTLNPRYFFLLAKHHKDNAQYSPLPHVIKLLLHPDVSPNVSSFVMEMIDNLLRDPEELEEEVMVIEVNDMIKLSSAESEQGISLGSRLLLPHISDILVYIQRYVTALFNKQTKKHNVAGKELSILSRLSKFVEDEERSQTLVGLLLPFMGPKFTRNAKTEDDILSSILNLLRQMSDRSAFFQPVSKLFGSLQNRPARVLLAQIFVEICNGNEDLESLAIIVQKINSWDMTKTEEPDYMQRLEGYRSASSLVKGMVTMDINICLTLLHNCCFFITTVEDMSLRDSSTLCVVNMVRRFGEVEYDEATYNTVIIRGLMHQLHFGLKCKSQTVLHEFVTILATLVDTFGKQSAFEDLRPLRDKDVEADFYENVKHIQVYKRSRAVRRLIKYLDTNAVRLETVNYIFLPIVSSFIMDDSYKKHATVQEAGVDGIGVICKVLPWKHYMGQLRFYLKQLPLKMEKQKLLVRVIVAILDNFHFDLNKSTLNVKNTPVPKVEREPVVKPVSVETFDKDNDNENPAADENVETIPEINEAVEEEGSAEELSKGRQLCSAKMATKIHESILKKVIPQLHHILVQKSKSDDEHKVNKSKFPEDEEILRVPIALAMVKLLQNLPKGALERFLPGILLKVCNFLKSRSPDIRNTARETLVKIQSTLGPRFFPFILSELRGCLTRGYQRHVLCYTVFMLLKNMEERVRPGDIDVCLKSLQQVFDSEIFGEVSDEKDVQGIKSKVFEARSSRSFESYEFIAKYISTGSLMKLMEPMKTILDTTHSQRSAKKVHDVLKKVIHGLLDNKNITVETLLVLVHGITTETIPLLQDKKTVETKPLEEKPGLRPQSCLLLQPEAPRGGLKPKTSKKTNKHVLVEFGLQLLSQLLKKQRLVATDTRHLEMLDPLVPMMADCLHSKYIMVNATCLRVLCFLLRFPLPSLRSHIAGVASAMFVLLRNYATAGAARGDNKELVMMLFKASAVTVLVREVKFHQIDNSQLQVLLTFCEEDIHDYNRQSTAFSLLKAILSRGLNIPEVHELMKKVEEMSISAESAHVQRECRQAMLQYLLDYSLGKKMEGHIQFYVSQLSFELESGRESALEMLAAFFTSFPQHLLSKYSGLFYLPMAASLVNDESVKCRKLIALAIKSLLGKLDHNTRSNLFSNTLKWFMDSKLRLRIMAAQLCGLFVEVEGGHFESRMADFLPVVEQHLEPGKYKAVEQEMVERDQDLMVYTVLNTLVKALRECPGVITGSRWEGNMNVIWEHVETYLSHAHLWVQLAADQLYGLLFAAWQPDLLVARETQTSTQYLTVDTRKRMKSLAIDFIHQLQSELLNEDIAGQVIKNLIFITKCARLFDERPLSKPDVEPESEQTDSTNEKRGRVFSVLWLVRKMIREAHHEAITNNKSTIKRMHVYKWLAAISLDLGPSMDVTVLKTMVPPLQRELNDQAMMQDTSLRTLAGEVIDLLKKTVGVERFTTVYASTQKERADRRDKRKQHKAFQAVSNPEVAAKRKLKKNLAKIAAKKRKIHHLKPSKQAKKRKLQEFAIAD